MYEYHATMTRIVDGDTLHARVDLGCDVRIDLTLRMYGLNAPELRAAGGATASEYVTDWFTTHAPDGVFLLRTVKDRREKYGRYLAKVYDTGAVHCLNDDLIAAGLATPYMVGYPNPRV